MVSTGVDEEEWNSLNTNFRVGILFYKFGQTTSESLVHRHPPHQHRIKYLTCGHRRVAAPPLSSSLDHRNINIVILKLVTLFTGRLLLLFQPSPALQGRLSGSCFSTTTTTPKTTIAPIAVEIFVAKRSLPSSANPKFPQIDNEGIINFMNRKF